MSRGGSENAQHYSVTENMGSVTISAAYDIENNQWVVPAKKLGEWLVKFDQYWRQESGIDDGKNLHWLYSKGISLRGHFLHRSQSELKTLSKYANSIHSGINWLILLESLEEIDGEKSEFLKSVGITNLTLFISADSTVTSRTVDMFTELTDNDINVTYYGCVSKLKECDAFNQESMNDRIVSLVNRPSGAGQLVFRRARKKNCANRIQLSIGTRGNVYPCTGLAGLQATRLGHIDDPISELFLKNRNQYLDIDSLVANGADLDEYLEAKLEPGVSLDCYFHRKQIAKIAESAN